MGSSDSRMKVLDVACKSLQRNLIVEPTRYVQPFRKFNSEYHKKSFGSQHESIIRIKAPEEEQIVSVTQQKFNQIEQVYEQKTKNFQIQAIIFDQYYTDRFTYVVKDLQVIKTVLIRPFQTYDSHTFGNIACEVNVTDEILKLPNKHLLKLRESYIIQNEEIKFENPKTQVFQFEGVAASLAQIIKYRRQNNWEWIETEFDQLVHDLCSALGALHESNICHNDIRPENVFYSTEKKCYLLGQFSYATKDATRGNLRNNRVSRYYISPQANSNEQYDFKKSDIFSLGSTLLCALYLCNPIDTKEAQKYSSRFRSNAGYRIVTELIKNDQQRKSISEIIKQLPNPNYENKSMNNLIESLRYKIKPRNKNQKVYKYASSEFFKRLGLWSDWREEVDEMMESNHNLTNYQIAELYEQLALIDYCQDELDQATINAKRAAKMFREMGEQALKEGDINLALKDYKKAVDCSRYYINPFDLDLAKSLICLSKGHAQKRQQQFSTTLLSQAKDLVIKQSSQDSILYSQMKIKQGELAKKFFRYEQSLDHLNEGLNTAKKMQPINQRSSKICQAKILTLMAQSQILLARKNDDSDRKTQKLQRAEDYLNDSKNIYQSLEEVDCHLELAENTQVLGLLYVEKKKFSQAKLCFEKSLQMRRWYQENKKQQAYIAQHGTTLLNLGRCERLMNSQKNDETYRQALRHEEQALEIFHKVYGSDHNYYSAAVLKQMGQLYDAMGQGEKSNQCFRCSKQIFEELYGQRSPYDDVGDVHKMLRH